jgi:hypothetical protein
MVASNGGPARHNSQPVGLHPILKHLDLLLEDHHRGHDDSEQAKQYDTNNEKPISIHRETVRYAASASTTKVKSSTATCPTRGAVGAARPQCRAASAVSSRQGTRAEASRHFASLASSSSLVGGTVIDV